MIGIRPVAFSLLLAAAAIAAAQPVTSAPETTAAASAPAAPDPSGVSVFVQKAARAGTFEIEASKLAARNAQASDVKAFAIAMLSDHASIAEELRRASGQIPLPSDVDPVQQSKLEALAKKTGSEFDRMYATDVGVAAHQDAVALFEEFSRSGPDGPLKQFAAATLPRLREHLAMAKRLQPAAEKTA
jgi:putative membrane protein